METNVPAHSRWLARLLVVNGAIAKTKIPFSSLIPAGKRAP
jgi:hypothetical protein